MMRSLFSGVSGLKTHQTKMDVIGNNIANVNTTSYKTMQINFSDLMYQTTQSATGPNATTGTAGTNPKQIGLGVQTAAISTKITEEGATQSTGNPFDLKISGDEFFVVSDGTNTFFTRDGSFYVDAAGNLAMSSTGYNVMGWGTETADDGTLIIKKDTVAGLQVMNEDNMTYPAEWTQAGIASGIIDWNDSSQSQHSGKTLNLQIFDNLGYSYTVKMSLHNAQEGKGGTDKDYLFYTTADSIVDSEGRTIWSSSDPTAPAVTFGTTQNITLDGEEFSLNNYSVKTQSVTVGGTTTTVAYVNYTVDAATGDTATIMLYPSDDPTFDSAINGATRLFNTDGTLVAGQIQGVDTSTIFAALYGTSIDPATINAATVNNTGTLIVTGKQITGNVLQFSGEDGKIESGGTSTLDLSNLGDAFTSISLDFSKLVVSDNGGTSTAAMAKGNSATGLKGRAIGSLQGISIQTNGMIYASYSNGQTKLLGQIAVAEFANASGLQKEGDNVYSATQNSGDFDGIGIDISQNGDSMNTGVLEMSNVDLSSEFTDMITTQRGFQANSRIITVSDTLIEELVNLKR